MIACSTCIVKCIDSQYIPVRYMSHCKTKIILIAIDFCLSYIYIIEIFSRSNRTYETCGIKLFLEMLSWYSNIYQSQCLIKLFSKITSSGGPSCFVTF